MLYKYYNNNEKYKLFVRDFESELISDKVMFYVLGVMYSYLSNPSNSVWTETYSQEDVKEAFNPSDKWTEMDWSFNYINQIFWSVSMKGLAIKKKFLTSYLRYGFSTVAVIVSNNLNKHLENGNNFIEFFFNGMYNLDEDSLLNLDESKCNSDLFSKLFLIFASLDFKKKIRIIYLLDL